MKPFNISQRPELNDLKPYVPGRSIDDVKQTYGLTDVIKLASNENPFGCPVTQIDLNQVNVYPDQNHHPLLKQLCKRHSVTPSHCILGNGSDDVLQMIGLALFNPSDSIVMPDTTFSVYKHVGLLMGADIVEVPLKDFDIDIEGIINAVTAQTKCVFISNPNNPTGTFLSLNQLRHLVTSISDQVLIVIDEAYREFVTSEPVSATESLIHEFPNVILLRTFSKAFGLAGLRIGYGLGSVPLIDLLQRVRQPFNVNQLALYAASEVLKNEAFMEKTLLNNAQEKDRIVSALSQWPLRVLPSESNFLCILGDFLADDCASFFIERGIIIRSLRSFGVLNGIRVTIGLPSQNQQFLRGMKEFLKQ